MLLLVVHDNKKTFIREEDIEEVTLEPTVYMRIVMLLATFYVLA